MTYVFWLNDSNFLVNDLNSETVQYSEVELSHCTSSLERKDKSGDRKKKGVEVGKRQWAEWEQKINK